MYDILFTRKAERFIKSLPEGHKNNLKNIIGILRENPFAYPYRKIRGETKIYRIRLGQYRMLYEVDEEKNRVTVLKLDKRSTVY